MPISDLHDKNGWPMQEVTCPHCKFEFTVATLDGLTEVLLGGIECLRCKCGFIPKEAMDGTQTELFL